jgi:hypothetical protein
MRERGDAEDERERRLAGLGAEEELALVAAVGERTGPWAEEQNRQRL